MKVLVVGATGQLAKSLNRVISREAGGMSSLFSFVSREDFLITDKDAVNKFFASNHFDAVINCTAYTAVDLAEDEPEQAYDVNVNAVKYLAEAAESIGAEFYHVSTDFVFDGEGKTQYSECDKTNPLSVYGKTKLEGEKIALEVCSRTQIIRTSWLYSAFGNNFVSTIIRLAKDRDKLTVVDDQVGTPTNAENLARAILKMVFAKKKHFGEVYHYSDGGECSWCDFAKEIVRLKEIDCKVLPIPSKDYPQKAHRPRYSVMDKSKIVDDYAVRVFDWRLSLKDFLMSL